MMNTLNKEWIIISQKHGGVCSYEDTLCTCPVSIPTSVCCGFREEMLFSAEHSCAYISHIPIQTTAFVQTALKNKSQLDVDNTLILGLAIRVSPILLCKYIKLH